MDEHIDKQGITDRLRRMGLWEEADALKEEARLRRRENGDDRETATTAAWNEMWPIYRPIVERLEAEKTRDSAKPRLTGLPVDLDSVLDPDYSETGRGAQLRDGLLWVALEWSRVIKDTSDGPVANIEAASVPPPNSWAITVLSTYALGGIDKRRELISKAIGFASKGQDKGDDGDSGDDGDGGYLDTLDL